MNLSLLSSTKTQLLISVLLAISAFVLFGYWALSLADRSESVTVVVAARDLEAPRIIQTSDIKIVSIRREAAPKTALVNLQKTIGSTLTHPLSVNQIITLNELAGKKINPELTGLIIPHDLKGFVLTSAWLAAPLPKLKKDDTLTLLVSAPGKDGIRNTGVLVQHASVLQAVDASDGTTQRALLALDITASLQLLRARANNFLIQALVDGLAQPLESSTSSSSASDIDRAR